MACDRYNFIRIATYPDRRVAQRQLSAELPSRAGEVPIKVITFWDSVPYCAINVLSVELVTAILRSLSLHLYFWNSQSARSGRKFVRGFNRARDLGFGIAPIKKSRGAIDRISTTKIQNKVRTAHPSN
jgi:hypothetical protein